MEEPRWAKLHHPPIDYQDTIYYSAPKAKKKSLDEVDPELLATFEKLGIPLTRARSSGGRGRGRGVRQRFGGHDVQEPSWPRWASSSARSPRRCASIPSWCASTWARWCPTPTIISPRSTRPSSATARSVYIPKGVRCPMELSTYFRINAKDTGQFERTLIMADEGAYVSYLEGCTAPMRDENQLHAAVVELVALDNAKIKYSTVQNWYPGDKEGKGGIYNFVTKRGACRGRQLEDLLDAGGDRLGHHLEVPELHPARRRFGRRVLLGGADQQQPAGRHRHEDDPHRQEHQEHDRLQGHHRRPRPEHLSRPGEDPEGGGQRAQLLAVRFAAAGRPVRRAHVPVHRSAEHDRQVEHEASTQQDRRRPDFLLQERGIAPEDAVGMIVNGFCKEVFRELPMEFAVEAQKLLGVSLEGQSVGLTRSGDACRRRSAN